MFRTIIIDDEKLAIQRLERLLEPHKNEIEIISEITSSKEAVDKINQLKPDLLFLDIQMPVYSGFDVLDKIKHNPAVIFVTAYDKYALKAFETNSVDYLLKPVEPERLKKAVEKLVNQTGEHRKVLDMQLRDLIKYFKIPAAERISVKSGSKILFLQLNDICFFKASEKYVEAFTIEKKYLLSRSLSELEAELSLKDFVRVHRSYIVNMNHIKQVERTDNGEYFIKLKDDNEAIIPVSRYLKHRLGL